MRSLWRKGVTHHQRRAVLRLANGDPPFFCHSVLVIMGRDSKGIEKYAHRQLKRDAVLTYIDRGFSFIPFKCQRSF